MIFGDLIQFGSCYRLVRFLSLLGLDLITGRQGSHRNATWESVGMLHGHLMMRGFVDWVGESVTN